MNDPRQDALKSPLQSLLPLMLTPRVAAMVALGVVFVVTLTSRSVPLAGLDAILFNYYNNTVDPRAVMYFNGWIHLLPEIVAYLSRGLPVTVQLAIYPAFAIVTALIMQQELQKLLQLWFRGVDAVVLSLIVLVYFQFYLPQFNQLVWCIWLVAVAALCHILRKNIAGEGYSWTGLTATALACLSNPTAVVFIPLLAVFSLTAQSPTLRRQDLALALLLLVFFAAVAAFKPAEAHYLSNNPIVDAARVVWRQVRHPSWRTIPPAIAILVLLSLSYAVFFRQRGDGPTRKALFALAYVGLCSLALYLFSGRAAITSTLPPRYTIVSAVAALLALVIYAAIRLDARGRRLLIVVTALGVVACELFFLTTRIRRSVGQARTQIAFARAADEFRKTCQPGEALAQIPRPSALAAVCTRIDVAPAADGPPIARRDVFGNIFAQGPQAKVWRQTGTVTLELLAPRR